MLEARPVIGFLTATRGGVNDADFVVDEGLFVVLAGRRVGVVEIGGKQRFLDYLSRAPLRAFHDEGKGTVSSGDGLVGINPARNGGGSVFFSCRRARDGLRVDDCEIHATEV